MDKVNQSNYCAIFENGRIKLEESSNNNIHIETMVDEDKPLVINTENSSMIFQDFERSNFHPGFDVFVYNNKTDTFLESSFINFENGMATMGR